MRSGWGTGYLCGWWRTSVSRSYQPPCNKINQPIDAIQWVGYDQPNQRILDSIILMEIHNPQNKEYLCSTCIQAFPNNEDYKVHYKSDYHRYNIKRKMVKLPPVTPDQFSTKLIETKNEAEAKFVCNQCRKTFASLKTLNQHVSSKGHNPNAIIEPRPKVQAQPAPFQKDHKRCFFCLKGSASLQENEEHMQRAHSFFIAQREFCKNPQGLIEYLQEKIEVGNLCITCENKKAKDFQSADAVRKHMSDRGHSVMKTEEGFEEYEKFYDFARLFDEKLKEQDKIVPGIEFQKVKVLVDEEEEKEKGGEEDWQDEDEEGSWQSQEEQQIVEKGEQAIKQQVKKPKVRVYQIMRPTLTANDELLLPNGKLLGHRKYRHIYRQTLRTPNWFASQFKQIAGSHSSNAIVDRRKLLDFIKKEQLINNHILRQKKHALRMGMTNNGLQHFFRLQLNTT